MGQINKLINIGSDQYNMIARLDGSNMLILMVLKNNDIDPLINIILKNNVDTPANINYDRIFEYLTQQIKTLYSMKNRIWGASNEYTTLAEFISDPNPHALSREEAYRIQPQYEDLYAGRIGSMFFSKKQIAEINNISIDELHRLINMIPTYGSIDHYDSKNKYGAIRFANNNCELLFKDYDPLWRYIHKYLRFMVIHNKAYNIQSGLEKLMR